MRHPSAPELASIIDQWRELEEWDKLIAQAPDGWVETWDLTRTWHKLTGATKHECPNNDRDDKSPDSS